MIVAGAATVKSISPLYDATMTSAGAINDEVVQVAVPLAVTFVAGPVVVPETVSLPQLVMIVSSFKALTPKFCTSVLFVRLLRFPEAS